jgi:hypothetical protein
VLLVQHEPATNSNLPKLQHRQSPAANVINGMLIRMGARCGGVDLDLESWDLTLVSRARCFSAFLEPCARSGECRKSALSYSLASSRPPSSLVSLCSLAFCNPGGWPPSFSLYVSRACGVIRPAFVKQKD